MKTAALLLVCIIAVTSVDSYTFVAPRSGGSRFASSSRAVKISRKGSTTLTMVDQNVLMGAGIAVAGLAAGIGLVAFTEAQGERAKERGGGLSESMSTRMAGQLIEDVEVSSVSDIGSLTSQLEKALKEASGTRAEELGITEDDKKRVAEEADDGW